MSSFVAAGTPVDTGGTAGSIGLPAGVTTDDLMLLLIETANQAITAPPSGWNANFGDAHVISVGTNGGGSAGGTTATRLTAYWKFHDGSESAPSLPNDPGDHTYAVILAFRGVSLTTPFDGVDPAVTQQASTNTALSCPTVTTQSANARVVNIASHNVDGGNNILSGSATNANLTGLAEHFDLAGSQGNGGGILVLSGVKTTAGASGATTGTLAFSSTRSQWSIVLRDSAQGTQVGKDLDLDWNVRDAVSKTLQLVWDTNTKASKDLELDWRVEANAQMVDADTASAEGATTPNWFAGDPAYTISRSTIHPSDGTHTWAFTSTDFLDMYVGTGIDPGQWFPIIEGQTYTYCADVSTELAGRDVHLRLLQYTDTEPSAFADIAGSDIITDTTTPQQLIITTTIATGLDIKWARLAAYWTGCNVSETHTLDRVGFQPGTSPVFPPLSGGATAVGKDLGLVWNVRQAVGKSEQLVWHVRTSVNKSLQLVWNIRLTVNKDLQLVWNVRQPVGKVLQLVWNVRAAVAKTLQLIWNTRTFVGKDLQLVWNTRASVGKDLQLVWNVYTSVAKTLQLIWNVLISSQSVGKNLGLLWNTRAAVGLDLQLVWSTRGIVGVNLQLVWNVTTPIGKSLQLIWKVQQSVGKGLNLVWDVYFQAVWTPVPIPNPTTMTPVIPGATVYTGTGPNASIWTEQVKPTTPWA